MATVDLPRLSAAAAESWTIIHGSVSLSVHICPSELQCCALAQNTELTQTHLHRSKSYDCMLAMAAVKEIIICKTAHAYCSLKSIIYKCSEKLQWIHNPQALTSVYVIPWDIYNLKAMAESLKSRECNESSVNKGKHTGLDTGSVWCRPGLMSSERRSWSCCGNLLIAFRWHFISQ